MRVLLILFLLIGTASAGVFRYQDSKGNLIYTDQPRVGEKQAVELPPATVSTTPKVTPEAEVKEKKKKEEPTQSHVSYKEFVLASPTDKQTFHNQRSIVMTIALTPVLQEGDKINIVLDGKQYAEITNKDTPKEGAYQSTLNNIDRGSHQLQAVLVNSDGKQIKNTNTITIYVHYAHLGTAGSGDGSN